MPFVINFLIIVFLVFNRGRYYYWDTSSDNVCWHSPHHPKAKIGKAAADMRLRLGSESSERHAIGPVIPITRPISVESDKERDREKDRAYHENRFKKPDNRDRRRRQRDEDELDPMDPSSYSDVPRFVQL